MDPTFEYIVNHLFMPPKLPQAYDQAGANDHALCKMVLEAAHAFTGQLKPMQKTQWLPVVKMLGCLTTLNEEFGFNTSTVQKMLASMRNGDVFAALIKEQNAGIIFRKQSTKVVCESFEVSAPNEEVMKSEEKLLCSYPGPAVSIPIRAFEDEDFLTELSSFLYHMHHDEMKEAMSHIRKAGSSVIEHRDTAHPFFITQVLTGILRGVSGAGALEDVPRVCKKIGDEVLIKDAKLPWRRSQVWLVIRVGLQTTLLRSNPEHTLYKSFLAFLHVHVLRQAVNLSMDGYTLFAMRAKTCRRAAKMGDRLLSFVAAEVFKVASVVESVLQGRWTKEIDLHSRSNAQQWDLSGLDPWEQTRLQLRHSRGHIQQALNRNKKIVKPVLFVPNEPERLRDLGGFRHFNKSNLEHFFESGRGLALLDFEDAVRDERSGWTSLQLENDSSMNTICDCMYLYHRFALTEYSKRPEDLSIMFLTLFDLWMALDRMALTQVPMLKKYPPVVHTALLEPLLLRKSSEIQRLERLVGYLTRRQGEASINESVFTYPPSAKSFYVQYYASSQQLKALRLQIESRAASRREAKMHEFEHLKDKYRQLSQLAQTLLHHHPPRMDRWGNIHEDRRECRLCHIGSEMKRMQIEVYEWPLPSDPKRADAVVFELNPPLPFIIWREATYFLLHVVAMASPQSPSSYSVKATFSQYDALKPFASSPSFESRITLTSLQAKSWMSTHYRTVNMSSTLALSDVCLEHGPQWELYDCVASTLIRGQFDSKSHIAKLCTMKIPRRDRNYKSFQSSVDSADQSQNTIISRQCDCPSNISLHEYIAFTHLRLGPQLQWLNLARNFACRDLSLSREEVHIVITQAVLEVGKIHGSQLIHHSDLRDPEFCRLIVRNMTALLTSIDNNWREVTTIRSVTLVSTRILSSCPKSVRPEVLRTLSCARGTTFRWLRDMMDQFEHSDGVDTALLRQRICDIALTCRATYDLDIIELEQIFRDDKQMIVSFLVSALVLNDMALTGSTSSSSLLETRDNRLSSAAVELVWKSRDDFSLINDAIRFIWISFRTSSEGWSRLPSPNDAWLSCQTESNKHFGSSQTVHLNLKNGRLLVDGKPLSLLPHEISGHSLYERTFGNRTLKVVPSGAYGSEFETRREFCGFQFLFSLTARGDLVIRRRKVHDSTGTVFELLPTSAFKGDLPLRLIENHFHWINLSSSVIELCPEETRFISSPSNWALNFSPSASRVHLGDTWLLDSSSALAKMIYGLLKGLEREKFIHVMYYTGTASIQVDLPRYSLSFWLSEGHLESRNFTGMIVDDNQSPGTLIGLQSHLVLIKRATLYGPLPTLRRVIIPAGHIHTEPCRDHICVAIQVSDTDRHIRFHSYEIDSDLGRLKGSNNLESHLYEAYLHALTSSYLPDPLTAHTGTEWAMQMLRSATSFSFQRLQEAEIELLDKICLISPSRSFYPPHLEHMQSIRWGDTPSFIQHPEFAYSILRILEYARRLSDAFEETPTNDISPLIRRRTDAEWKLLSRASLRVAMLFPPSLGQGKLSKGRKYEGRDLSLGQEQTFHAISAALFRSRVSGTRDLPVSPTESLEELFLHWNEISGMTDIISLSYAPGTNLLSPDIADVFISIYESCRKSVAPKKIACQLVFSASMLVARRSTAVSGLVPYLLAFSANQHYFKDIEPPSWSSYLLHQGTGPSVDVIRGFVDSCVREVHETPSHYLLRDLDENEGHFILRQSDDYKTNCEATAEAVVAHLIRQWPTSRPVIPHDHYHEYTNISDSMETLFQQWVHNRDLLVFIRRVQGAWNRMGALNRGRGITPPLKFDACWSREQDFPGYSLNLRRLMMVRSPPDISTLHDVHDAHLHFPSADATMPSNTTRIEELRELLQTFHHTGSKLRARYASELSRSIDLLSAQKSEVYGASLPISEMSQMEVFEKNVRIWSATQHAILNRIYLAFQATKLPGNFLSVAGLWPRVTWRSLLTQLSSEHRAHIPLSWVHALTYYSLIFMEYQHTCLLLSLSIERRHTELARELSTPLLDSCLAEKYPDWLLIQIDSGFRARPIQTLVAKEMIAPTSGKSTVLQLNMGEGKTSVIVPMASASLSNSRALVRVIVLKSLATQTFQLLRARLSHLTGRRIFFLPFSRKLKVTPSRSQHMKQLFRLCMDVGGVLVAQPEHILSLTLMSVDHLLSHDVGRDVFELQRFALQHSRDVIDESDEVLHPRYALVYTRGHQAQLEGHPNRWTITQQLFSLLQGNISRLAAEFPRQLLIQERAKGSFPLITILPGEYDLGEKIKSMLSEEIRSGKLMAVHFRHLQPHESEDVMMFLTEEHRTEELEGRVKAYFANDVAWPVVLVLRGLLAFGIFIYSITERRWRVDYGLDLNRSALAVPYRAKDVPSLQSEFGHPDVAIALTCLTYYYDGLSVEQLKTCFDELFKLDNPSLEYETWIGGVDIPRALQNIGGINIDDSRQREEDLFPLFSHNHNLINFYLSHFVFPKEAKQFPYKLPSSGWDLAGEGRQYKTGFSGTNDNRYLLPAPIQQSDPINQDSTNAYVLQCLLRPENNNYHRIMGVGVTRFLQFLNNVAPEIRVILDVGAQMLDEQNVELVTHWLEFNQEAGAAIYFNEDDELTVLTQDGIKEPFASSPFNGQLDQCIVYLDDSHTRGTDLKLPRGTKAAVTLGRKVTKDRLVQGCMRMRQLGKGQSVAFFAPTDVDMAIRKEANKSESDEVAVIDILRWCMYATIADIEHHIPHWANQGLDYIRRRDVMRGFVEGSATIKDVHSAWVQIEAKTLEEMYFDRPKYPHTASAQFFEVHERLVELGVREVSGVDMDEEQEREVDHEIESERQTDPPPVAFPKTHQKDPALEAVIRRGAEPGQWFGFIHLFEVARGVRFANVEMTCQKFSPLLLATKDYSQTVHHGGRVNGSEYLKPLNWILSVRPKETRSQIIWIVLSPFDVNSNIAEIRTSPFVHLHVFSPRVTGEMPTSFDSLSFYTIPPISKGFQTDPLVLTQLRLFAGQLYLPSYESYVELCNFLGLSRCPVTGVTAQTDGFVLPKYRHLMPELANCPFTTSPVPFLHELVSLRRKGNNFRQTHIGRLLSGRILHPEDFKTRRSSLSSERLPCVD